MKIKTVPFACPSYFGRLELKKLCNRSGLIIQFGVDTVACYGDTRGYTIYREGQC